MGFSTVHIFIVKCDGEGCLHSELDTSTSMRIDRARTSAAIDFKEKGWKTAQRKGTVDTSYNTAEEHVYDCEGRLFKAWFCPDCVKAGKIAEWHERIKEEYPLEDY